MKKVKFTPVAALVISLTEGVEVETIVDEQGVLFVPMANMGAFLGGGKQPVATSTTTTASAGASNTAASEPQDSKFAEYLTWTEEDMRDNMETKDLEKVCIKLNIDIPTEGKNTNMKFRKLILDWQKKSKSKGSETAATPTGGGAAKPAGSLKKIEAVLADVDSTTLTQDEGEEELLKLVTTKADKTAVRKLYQEFIDDSELDVADVAKSIAEVVDGDSGEPKEGAKPTGRGAGKSAVKLLTTLDEYDTLKEGQRVSVYWEDEEAWFNGEVAEHTDDGVLIAYDDETEGVLDDTNTSKVKLL